MTLYRTWTDPAHFDLDRLIATLGNLPPDLIEMSFDMLRPFQKTAGNLKLLDNVQDETFVKAHLRFERWAADQIPFAGETARQFITDFLARITRGELRRQCHESTLGRSGLHPHVAAEHDHTVPQQPGPDRFIGSKDKNEIADASAVAGANAVHRLCAA
jgi:polyhydroxyalkanoate synthase